MAGMFSMLNNSHLRLDSCGVGGTSGSYRDECGRITPKRSPLPIRRNQGLRNYANQSARYSVQLRVRHNSMPRGMRRSRCELHPMIRRSVCTLLLSVLSLLTGTVLVMIDMFLLEVTVPVKGLTFLGVGVILGVFGFFWFAFSKQKLEQLKQKAEKVRADYNNFASLQVATKKSCLAQIPRSNSCIRWPKSRSGTNNDKHFSRFQLSITAPKDCCDKQRNAAVGVYTPDDDEVNNLLKPSLERLEIPYTAMTSHRQCKSMAIDTCCNEQIQTSGSCETQRSSTLDESTMKSNYSSRRHSLSLTNSEISCPSYPASSHHASVELVDGSARCDSSSDL